MKVIEARNVCEAWPLAIDHIVRSGVLQSTRAGDARVLPHPVTTVYRRPTERVLFDAARNANPIFHLHEALWMLAGRNDARWLDQFVRNFSRRFAESSGEMHGAYGHRWRRHFAVDQIAEAIRLLRANPNDRQVVIQMWDAEVDFGIPDLKDRPCNTHIYFRADSGSLDMTVLCRSNDAVYGAYGANVVHMSILQEYVAAASGLPVGVYRQVSNNLHAYVGEGAQSLDRVAADALRAAHLLRRQPAPGWSLRPDTELRGVESYPVVRSLVDDPATFIEEVEVYVQSIDPQGVTGCHVGPYRNSFIPDVAIPMYEANRARLDGDRETAIGHARSILADDWREATVGWIVRVMKEA